MTNPEPGGSARCSDAPRSTSEIAELSGAAISTVVRACQNLGFGGFQDLELSIAPEGVRPATEEIHSEVPEGDRPRHILQKLRSSGLNAINSGVDSVDPDQFEEAVRVIAGANGGIPVLLGVTLSVPDASGVGLVGETGSGKSMTARVATGLLSRIGGRVAGGSLRIHGEEMARADNRAWRRHRGGTV